MDVHLYHQLIFIGLTLLQLSCQQSLNGDRSSGEVHTPPRTPDCLPSDSLWPQPQARPLCVAPVAGQLKVTQE